MGATSGDVETRGESAPGGCVKPPGSGVPPRCHPRGCSGPKMRHLVLYKLVDGCQTDKEPLNGGYARQKSRKKKKNLPENAQKWPILAVFRPKMTIFDHFWPYPTYPPFFEFSNSTNFDTRARARDRVLGAPLSFLDSEIQARANRHFTCRTEKKKLTLFFFFS